LKNKYLLLSVIVLIGLTYGCSQQSNTATTTTTVATTTTTTLPAGTLDLTFGVDGRAEISFVAGDDQAVPKAVKVQPDGKIIVVGGAVNASHYFDLARLNSDGSLDAGFGTGGMTRTSFGSGNAYANGLALQDDGKILVCGHYQATNIDFALARYNADGSLDSTFGTGGKVTTDFGGNEYAYAIGVQSDGKIVVGGDTNVGATQDFVLARYNTDGSLDVSFGSSGKVMTDVSGHRDYISALRILSDGKIVAAGYRENGATNFALAKYTTTGTLDAAFGSNGTLEVDFAGGSDRLSDMALQPDGKILVVGSSGKATSSLTVTALARLNSDGSLDTSFNGTGKITQELIGNNLGKAVRAQNDGKIITAGYNSAGPSHILLSRYLADGTPDAGFGSGGMVNTILSTESGACALDIQSNGMIVAAGYSNGTSYSGDFVVLRYWP
jgi:uncharacterized delta-60 repeat protein